MWGQLALEAQAAYFAALAPAGEARSRPGLVAVRTGAFSNTENGVAGNDADADEIAELLAWLGGLPASWIATDPAPGLAERLVAAGCRPERSGVDMGARLDRIDIAVAPPPGIEIVRVDARTAYAWMDVAERCGWIEHPSEREPRRRVLLDAAPEVVAYVALDGDRPVGMACALYLPDTVSLLALAVVEDERRRGIGRALAAIRLAEGRSRGCRYAVLAPSPEGEQLYRSLGFELDATPPDRWFYTPVRPDEP